MVRKVPPSLRWSTGDAFFIAILTAGVFLDFDVLKAHRSSFWVGIDTTGWLHILAVFCLYTMFFLFANVLFTSLGKSLSIKNFSWVSWGTCVVALCTWWCIVALGKTGTRFAVWGVPAVTILLMVGIKTLLRLMPERRVAFLGGCVVALASIPLTTAATHHWLFLSEHRTGFVAVVPITYALGFALVCWILSRHASALRRIWLVVFCIAALLAPVTALLLSDVRFSKGISGTSRNILLITCDALRADRCSVYGGPVPTPTLEACAREGVVFENAFSLAPWTLPSMIGLFTSSLQPGISENTPPEAYPACIAQYRVPESVPTLAEMLSAKGYATAAFVGNTLLDETSGLLRGFQYVGVFGHRTVMRYGWFPATPLFQAAVARFFPALAPEHPVDTSHILTEHVKAALHRFSNKPFFIWVHFMDPHAAYDPPEKYRTLKGALPVFCNSDPRWGWTTHAKDPHTGDLVLSQEERAYVQSLYDGEIRYVDECIGKIVRTLQNQGVDENTLLCITSDHGEEFWEHQRYGHGHSLYQELVRVPLILVDGSASQNRRISAAVSGNDIMPTLAVWSMCEIPPQWQGTSLWNLITGKNDTSDGRICVFQGINPYVGNESLCGVSDGNWKLIQGKSSRSTYDLRHDPHEKNDSAVLPKEVEDRFLETITEAERRSPPLSTEETQTPDFEDAVRRLRAVGYL